MHRIFAELCSFESFCKLFVAYCLEVIVCKFYLLLGIFFTNNLSYGDMGNLFIYLLFFLTSFIRFARRYWLTVGQGLLSL